MFVLAIALIFMFSKGHQCTEQLCIKYLANFRTKCSAACQYLPCCKSHQPCQLQ